MSEISANQALAKAILRIIDRIIPPLSVRKISRSLRYGATFLGTFIWSYFCLLFYKRSFESAQKGASTSESEQKEASTNGVDYFPVDLNPNETYLQIIILIILPMLFTTLIARSIKRGTILNFFILGLSIPTLAWAILRLAFFFELGNGGDGK